MGRIPSWRCVRLFVMTGYALAPQLLGQSNSSYWPLNLAVKEADRRGEELGLTDDEVAFYEALEVNDSA